MAPGDDDKNVAIIFGVTGLVGREIAKRLASNPQWDKVYGVARHNPDTITSATTDDGSPNYHFIPCDLLDSSETRAKLSPLNGIVTHVFWVTWASGSPLDSAECCDQNKEMLSNSLAAILPDKTAPLRYVSLQTGTKHYVSLRGSDSSAGGGAIQRYDEDCPRVRSDYSHNFYYCLEDLLKERLGGRVRWSVHRPGLIMGSSRRSAFNVVGCLGVYGAICKRLGLPFVFGGTMGCWEETSGIDGSDARLVAEQHIWAAKEVEIRDQGDGEAFNAVNGDGGFAWSEIWSHLGAMLGVEEGVGFSPEFRFAEAMGDKGAAWGEIVEEEGLVRTEMGDLANWGFLDALFRCPVRMLGSREKADRMGFTERYGTLDSILYWIDRMRREKLLPP